MAATNTFFSSSCQDCGNVICDYSKRSCIYCSHIFCPNCYSPQGGCYTCLLSNFKEVTFKLYVEQIYSIQLYFVITPPSHTFLLFVFYIFAYCSYIVEVVILHFFFVSSSIIWYCWNILLKLIQLSSLPNYIVTFIIINNCINM